MLGGSSPSQPSNGEPLQPAPKSHFEVNGRLLSARVRLDPTAPSLSELTIEDNVALTETQTAQPGDQPIRITGNHLHVENASGNNAVATIAGQPARFEGQDMALTGAAINLDRAANRLGIDGAGQMDITMKKDLDGKPLPAPTAMTVNWGRRMEFDGRTATFDESVVAAMPNIQTREGTSQFGLKTARMEVQLQQPIHFADSKAPENTQIEEIRCLGGVAVDSHSFDPQRQLVSHDRMEVTDLAVNRINGVLKGGPGWVNTVRYGSDDMLGGQPAATPAAAAPAKPKELYCLHVSFKRSLSGNILQRQLTAHEDVWTTCGPVDNWDAMFTTRDRDPARLGPKGVVAHCDELAVYQMLLPLGGDQGIELYALGNAKVEGTTFTAVGNRITYAQAKDLFVIEGDGRSPAVLYQQKQPGDTAAKFPAQKILYWRKTGAVNVIGAQLLEVELPGGSGRK